MTDDLHLRAIEDESAALTWHPFEGDETEVRLLSDKIVTARKSHWCHYCNGPIHPGERHRARAELNCELGRKMTFRFCADCLNAYEAEQDCDDGWPFQDRCQLYPRQTAPLETQDG